MKIAVGTTSSWKIKFLDEVLSEMGVEAELETFGVDSEVPDQPIGENEVKKGSINRANKARKKSDNCDFALGVEFGYQKEDNGMYQMFCYATAKDEDYEVTKRSSMLELPRFFQELLEKGEDLGEHTKEYEEQDHHASGFYLARIVRYREPFIKEAIRNALLIFLHKEEF